MSDAGANENSGEQVLRQATAARRSVLAKGDIFTSTQLWTVEFAQRARRWLQNFEARSEADKRLAAALLDGFLYFSDQHATELMIAGFHALSPGVVAQGGNPDPLRLWTDFFDNVVVTYAEGEVRNATDSGLEAARKFRKRTPFPQARIMPPSEALWRLASGRAKSVVFVDDFMGTGNQFVSTWSQQRDYQSKTQVHRWSFADITAQLSDVRAYYCPSVSTRYALDRLAHECPDVVVSPGAILDDRYDVMHPDSRVWPPALRTEGQDFVRRVSEELGFRETGGAEDDLRGFHGLGLAMGIRDSIPDATLRIFRYEEKGWSALMKDA